MNPAIKTSVLPSLTADYLSQSNVNIDNTFNAAWKRLGFKSMLLQAKFHKRSVRQSAMLFIYSCFGFG
jgi:hypothetical protein